MTGKAAAQAIKALADQQRLRETKERETLM
jgi:hypothetical protein